MAAALLTSASVRAQDSHSYILAVRRSGAIEIIDPTSLATIGRIHFDLPPKSSGLNGISASADGSVLYVEGPVPNGSRPGGCCVLYSVDLATLQTRQVAGIPGTSSRAAFITSNGITAFCDRACWNQIIGASPWRRCAPFPRQTSAPHYFREVVAVSAAS